MSRPCSEVEELLDARRRGLTEAEKLDIEEHLSGCARCERGARELDAVLALFGEMPRELDPARRERVIGRALATVGRPQRERATQSRYAIATCVLAAAAAAVLVWLSAAPAPELSHVAPAVAPPAAGRGAQASPKAPELAEEDRALLSPAPGTRLTFAHANIVTGADATLRFLSSEHVLELSRGEVDVEVDPAPHAPFSVRTPEFTVEVLGTGFRVSQSGVDVRHGRVRVVSLDGSVLAAGLGAGDHWQIGRTSAPGKPARAKRAAAPDLASALTRVRSALARGAAGDAEQLLSTLSARDMHDRAELDSLRAECALVAGDLERAQQRYLQVSERYRRLAAGENALFAAQKLARRRGDRALARQLSGRYLERYPAGQFVAELTRARGE